MEAKQETNDFPLSEKALDFITSPLFPTCTADFLEGTTNSGKSTITIDGRFPNAVSASEEKYHLIVGRTKGIAARNLLQQKNGFCDVFKGQAIYYPNGNKVSSMPHVEWEDKIIFVAGYSDKKKWQDILGGRYGVAFVDEMNIADIDFLNELSFRCDYMIGTLNPDDDRLPVYKNFINRSRPYKKYEKDVPPSIMKELLKGVPRKGWHYWFFSFDDNLSLTPERIEKIKGDTPPGTKQYRNKVLGLRGRCEGLVFGMFKEEKNVVSKEWVKQQIENGEIVPLYFTCGVDTAYSSKSEDTTVFIFQMITADRKCIVLDEEVLNNKGREESLSPSDIVPACVRFLDKNCREWGGHCPDVYIDNADSGTIAEFEKYRRNHWGCQYNFTECFKSRIFERIKMQQSWIHTGHYLVCDHCTEHLTEITAYTWDDKKIDTPVPFSDHTINSAQYAFEPFKWDIGLIDFDRDEEEDY